MKLRFGVFLGAVAVYSVIAQEGFDTANLSDDPVEAAKQMQQQAQFQFENQMAELERNANATKEPLIQQRNTLNQAIQDCFIQKNEKALQAQEQADAREQAATNQMINSVPQALTPLVQSATNANNQGKEAAANQRESAIADQNTAFNIAKQKCAGTTSATQFNAFGNGLKLSRADGSDAKNVLRNAQTLASGAAGGSSPQDIACFSAANALVTATNNAKRDIDEAKKADGATTQNLIAAGMAAVTLGINYYGYQGEKKAAANSLDKSNEMNDLSYDACKEGVLAQAKEIDRQLANIDQQLAADKDRLARQFSQFKVTLPANIASKNILEVDGDGTTVVDDGLPLLGGAGNPISPASFGGKTQGLNGFAKNQGAAGGGPAAAGGGAGGGASGGDSKAPWGFRDPYEPNNPGLAFGLPNQPDKAQMVAGAGEDVGQGQEGNDPFGPGFLGFDDPFANANKDAALAAEGKGGNGFWELAMKTRRRVYAHLSELLGKPTPKVGKDGKPEPQRKISSIRE